MMQVANSAHPPSEARHPGVAILTGRSARKRRAPARSWTHSPAGRRRWPASKPQQAFAHLGTGPSILVDLSTGRTVPLCRDGGRGEQGEEQWGRFAFTRDGLRLGREALGLDRQPADVVIVDEVGPLELSGGGWAGPLDGLLDRFDGPVLLVARPAVVEAVRTRWGAASTPVCDVSRDGPDRIAGVLLDRLARRASDAARAPAAAPPAG